MTKYNEPEMEVIFFESADILTTSEGPWVPA